MAISNQSNDIDNGGLSDSDLAIVNPSSNPVVVWVNGTQLIGLDLLLNLSPDAALVRPFPYKRLASFTAANQPTSYLYHQINGTTLAEEQYLSSEGQWIASSYIMISGS